jgi:hypothetical protein
MRLRQNFKISVSAPRDWKAELSSALIVRSSWMFVFVFICYLIYSKCINEKNHIDFALQSKIEALELRKKIAMERQGDLALQIESQNDPAWVQLTLMKGLGVVPEGQIKVYFSEQ